MIRAQAPIRRPGVALIGNEAGAGPQAASDTWFAQGEGVADLP